MFHPLSQALETAGLGGFVELFEDADVDMEVFLFLTEGDLAELGIKVGPRKKLVSLQSQLQELHGVNQDANEDDEEGDDDDDEEEEEEEEEDEDEDNEDGDDGDSEDSDDEDDDNDEEEEEEVQEVRLKTAAAAIAAEEEDKLSLTKTSMSTAAPTPPPPTAAVTTKTTTTTTTSAAPQKKVKDSEQKKSADASAKSSGTGDKKKDKKESKRHSKKDPRQDSKKSEKRKRKEEAHLVAVTDALASSPPASTKIPPKVTTTTTTPAAAAYSPTSPSSPSLPALVSQGYIKNKDKKKMIKLETVPAINADEIEGASSQGWLWKQGGKVKTWKKRWFVLKGPCLYYFPTPSKTRAKGMVTLPSYEITTAAEHVNREFAFQAYHPSARTYIFVANNNHDMQHWIQVMTAATKGAPVSFFFSFFFFFFLLFFGFLSLSVPYPVIQS